MKKLVLLITCMVGVSLQAQVGASKKVYCQVKAMDKKLMGAQTQTLLINIPVTCQTGLRGGFDKCCRDAITTQVSAAPIFKS